MTDAVEDTPEEAAKASKVPLILGVVALLLGVGGGFFATFSGIILAPESATEVARQSETPAELPNVSFVAIEPMVISLAPSSQGRHLRFRAQLEVPSQHAADVESILPRVVDVLNGYLRALETKDIESPAALMRLRAQMLRRVQIVTGAGRVNDLLIMEFVLS
ncbi:flagellar basal body-associated FliL family protein [Tateyamaria omphalii]|uniref:flagellar basal body-associated FliL family protein n=1 Tax=Tateyamaria omphalii TaxID=299262 RepID=UPI001C98F7D0|nr:flagellar basal body-associated FliL family protein [Tateyamaria omphalii]MBY5933636.1 flagellar basal body-associated FliL family protein [Tateyamaria omphalii]